jgi:hypothetical protein
MFIQLVATPMLVAVNRFFYNLIFLFSSSNIFKLNPGNIIHVPLQVMKAVINSDIFVSFEPKNMVGIGPSLPKTPKEKITQDDKVNYPTNAHYVLKKGINIKQK